MVYSNLTEKEIREIELRNSIKYSSYGQNHRKTRRLQLQLERLLKEI